jgi:hypothetical protein
VFPRHHARYLRAARRAFLTVPFYREQWARAGRPLAEPEPTPTGALPDPPGPLCPFARPWSAACEPSLWTPDLVPLAPALLDRTRLPWSCRPYRVLLAADAMVASPARRRELNAAAWAAAAPGPAWVVGPPDELDLVDLGPMERDGPRAVYRLPVSAAAVPHPVRGPALLHDPFLGYLGALVPDCRRLHLDWRRVYARDRDAMVTFSRLDRRRPTLLDLVPPGAGAITVGPCPRHGTPVLGAR